MPKMNVNLKLQKIDKKLKLLAESDRSTMIKLVKAGFHTHFCVSISGSKVKYTGLKPRIKEVYYPELEENPIKNKNKRKLEKNKPGPSNQKSECPSYGIDHGEAVHSQMEQFFHITGLKKKSVETFFDCVMDIDPCTKGFINFISMKKWSIVSSEYSIFDEDLKIATKIDMLVFDPVSIELILVELKTGYEGET
jgi:hypothetical protein